MTGPVAGGNRGERGGRSDDPGTVRVLHVEDDLTFAEMTATFLERAHDAIEVTSADGPDDAIALLETETFDCIVSDYDMPGRNGIEFLETVRESGADIPFILFTGKGSEAVASRAISAGVDDYLQKETGTDQYTVLANRIVNYVRTARGERERERLMAAIETAREGIAILDEDGRFVYLNRRFGALYGYEPSALLGESCERVLPERTVDRTRERVLPDLEAGRVWDGEGTGRRADGTTFVGHHVLSVADAGGYVWTVRDTTERRARERGLEQYERLLETMGDAVAALDMDGNLTQVNGRMTELTGYSREDLVGAHASLYLDEADVAKGNAVVGRLLSDGDEEPGVYDVTVRRADGTSVPAEIRQTLLPPHDGRVRGTVGTLREVQHG